MLKEKTESLIKKINDPSIISLFDISSLTYSAFLRKTENSLSLEESHYVYQQAIHARRIPVQPTGISFSASNGINEMPLSQLSSSSNLSAPQNTEANNE